MCASLMESLPKMTGIYSFNTPDRLFRKLQSSFSAFYKNPSEDGLWDVLFPMYHLREWIHPDSHYAYSKTPEDKLTREQRLHRDLHSMDEYALVRELCNRAKHFATNEDIGPVVAYQGARCGWMNCRDSLGVTHFTVNGREIRNQLALVMRAYALYFHPEETGPSS